MKYELALSSNFKKGIKVAKKRGLDISLLDAVVNQLLQGTALDEKYRDHPLKENGKDLGSVTFSLIGC